LSFAYTSRSVDEELARARAWWNEQIALARRDPNAFCELAFRDDQTPGSPAFAQQWFHREWQRLWLEDRFSVVLKATGFGGTDQAIAHAIWRLGKNPNLRVSFISKTVTKAQDRLAKVKRNIEENAIVREVFPDLLPGEKWNSEVLRVKGASLDTTTDSVNAFGEGADLLGTRIDLGFLDDVNDDENTRTPERRDGITKWADKSVITRLTTRGQLHVIANAFHPQDLAHSWRARPGFAGGEYPAERPGPGGSRVLLWPSFRSAAWLDDIKSKMTPTAYAQMYLCQARDEGTRVFKSDWFTAARKRGENLQPVRSVPQWSDEINSLQGLLSGHARRNRMRVVVGTDLATGKKERKRKSDLTVFFVLGVWLDTGRRQPLWIEAGRWPAAESMDRLRQIQLRYHPERFLVESNGAQDFFVQFARHFPDCTPRVEGFDTSAQKWDEALGVEGIGVELQAGRWALPGPAQVEGDDAASKAQNAALLESYLASLGPERQAGEADWMYAARRAVENPLYREAYGHMVTWAEHLKDFHRAGHTSDYVMASYFAKEAALRLAAGVFQPLNLHGAPHPESPAAEAERERLTVGNAGNFHAPPAPPPAPPPVPLAAATRAPAPFRLPPPV
jgi:hypothetical protein